MNKVVAFCSSRGGTGKTTIAANLAVYLATKGLNTAVIDLDFRAPSFFYIFRDFAKEPVKRYTNDYLDSDCEPEDFLVHIQTSLGTKGKLLVGVADPSIEAIEEMAMKSRSWEARALQKLFRLRSTLDESFDTEVCILDTSPGIHYSSLNAIVASDAVVLVTSPSRLDLEAVASILDNYADIIKDKFHIIVNKTFPLRNDVMVESPEEAINTLPQSARRRIIHKVPCYCSLLTGDTIQIIHQKEHPLREDIARIANNLNLS